MGPNLYTQTPGAIHMGGGFANPFAAHDTILGNIYGTSRRGDRAAQFASNIPSHLLMAGTAASIASGFGIGGALTAGVGATLGLGALPMLPAMLGTAALGYGASQMSRGHQQNMISADLSKRVFGERNLGGLRGMGASRDSIAGFSSAFRELANSSEMLTNDEELKNVLTKFSDMKLLDTSKNLGEMATRVKKMSKTLREISMDLGTTLEGALPSVQRHAQMGFTDMDAMRQSIRTNRTLRGVGINMSDSTITSFEMAQAATNFAQGGDKKIGALGAQRTLGTLSTAASMGLLTDEKLMAATGKRGEEAVADLAQQSMQASSSFMNSSYGQMVAAALGEVKDGKFTGNIDQEARARMSSMTSEELSTLADQKLNEGGAASFRSRMQSGMGANMAAQLDMSEFANVFDKIFKDEEEMKVVLERLTGMRGQTFDVLRSIQKDSERVVGEFKRRSNELSVRNRLNSEIQQKFTLGGRLNTAYREMLAEPIGQPLQESMSNMSTSVGNYVDNYGTQIISHGILEGLTRGTLGVGIGEDLGEQSYADRTSDIRQAISQQFDDPFAGTTAKENNFSLGTAALGVGIGMYNPVVGGMILGKELTNLETDTDRHNVFVKSEEERRAQLIEAGMGLNEFEYENFAKTTTFGQDEEGFVSAVRGDREDVEYTQNQKLALLRGINAGLKEDNLKDMTEEFTKTAYNFGDDGPTNEQRALSEARGGNYGDAKQLANDMSLTAGQRRAAQEYVDRIDKKLKAKITLEDEDRVRDEQEQANVAVTDLFVTASEGDDSIEIAGDGGELVIKNTYLAEEKDAKNFNKLRKYMQGLTDKNVIKKLTSDERFSAVMDAEDAVGLAKDVFGVEIKKAEGERALTFFKALVDKHAVKGDAFADSLIPGAKEAVEKLNRKIRTDGVMRGLTMRRDLENSDDLEDTTREELTKTYNETVGGKTAEDRLKGAADFFDTATELETDSVKNVRGVTGEAIKQIRAFSEGEGTVAENLVANIRKKYGDEYSRQELESMAESDEGLEELKALAVRASLAEQAPATRGSVAGAGVGNLDPENANKLMQNLSDSVAQNIETMTQSTMRMTKAQNEEIKKNTDKNGNETMTFVESTTKVVKLGNSSSIPSVIIKDTITVEDIVFLHARTAAVRKKSNIAFSTTSQNIRQQITRVPHGR